MSYCTTCLSSAQLGHEKTDNMQQLETNKQETQHNRIHEKGNENQVKDEDARTTKLTRENITR